MPCYYKGRSVSGQDDLNRALWLATRADKMEPSCPLGTTRCIPQAKLPRKPYHKSFIDQVCSVKMAGYWPRSFFASLWTSTSSPSLNTQKKNLANIQSYYMALSHKDWELPNFTNLIGWNGYWPRSRFSHLDRHNVLKGKSSKLKCKVVDCFHLAIFISVSAKKLMRKKVKRTSKLWKN